jgi:pectate lyase
MKRLITLFFTLIISFAHAQQPIGWASENGGTTGGAGGATIIVTSASELAANAKSASPMIIKISGKITCDRVDVASNKTIEGEAQGATLNGSLYIYGSSVSPKRNICIRNLVIAKESGSTEDVVSMQYAQNIWVDHCDISDSRTEIDGLCDMTHACNFITVSWTKFSYSNAIAAHRLCMLISHDDNNEAEDLGKLKITLHHNWWAQNVIERMPRMRFCQVHSFNNYFSSKGNNYCIGAGRKAQVLIESNYFENVTGPHIFYDNDATAIIGINSDNQYVTVAGNKSQGQGTCFKPPYSYALDKGSSVKEIVLASVGPNFDTSVNVLSNRRNLQVQAPVHSMTRGNSVFSVIGRSMGVNSEASYTLMPVIQVQQNKKVRIELKEK